jgi:hypothetical protein
MSASAIVNVTLRVMLSQPWSDKESVGGVIKQAKHEALSTVARLIKDQTNINLVDDPKVKIIYEEGK